MECWWCCLTPGLTCDSDCNRMRWFTRRVRKGGTRKRNWWEARRLNRLHLRNDGSGDLKFAIGASKPKRPHSRVDVVPFWFLVSVRYGLARQRCPRFGGVSAFVRARRYRPAHRHLGRFRRTGRGAGVGLGRGQRLRREDAQAGWERQCISGRNFADHEEMRRIGFERGGWLIGAAEDVADNRNRGPTGGVGARHRSGGGGVEERSNARERAVEQAVDVSVRDTELAGGGDALVVTDESETLHLSGDVPDAGLRNQVADQRVGQRGVAGLSGVHKDAGAARFEVEGQRVDEAAVREAVGEGHGSAAGGGVEGHRARDWPRHAGGTAGRKVTDIVNVAIDVHGVSAGDDHLADGHAGERSLGDVRVIIGPDQSERAGAIHRAGGKRALGADDIDELGAGAADALEEENSGGGDSVIRVTTVGDSRRISIEVDGSAARGVGGPERTGKSVIDAVIALDDVDGIDQAVRFCSTGADSETAHGARAYAPSIRGSAENETA